jgi:hypothetical protein
MTITQRGDHVKKHRARDINGFLHQFGRKNLWPIHPAGLCTSPSCVLCLCAECCRPLREGAHAH